MMDYQPINMSLHSGSLASSSVSQLPIHRILIFQPIIDSSHPDPKMLMLGTLNTFYPLHPKAPIQGLPRISPHQDIMSSLEQ